MMKVNMTERNFCCDMPKIFVLKIAFLLKLNGHLRWAKNILNNYTYLKYMQNLINM